MRRSKARAAWSGFVLDKEKIRQFRDCSPYAKLQWLEDANNFLLKALSKKKRQLWEKFRRGEI
ncbi:MAG: hypothetical protein NTZ78_03550 [Candidatus Aureabacteria bacterium]|nr:hypothetical protein [Candidatus Auribacterota bacterium]